ncbi:hypothetical protein PoB_005625400 [Plakobranchus ocellatus]|uniref:Uncharacterized protein n=1 Tax=Plakobranchus ocellatus TaxID=259542 RepID=A0AAV4CAZ8_9GAST|nr:hypothetical protein PoB_005625400 [Plakobranchus ocellatus]
MWKLSSFPLALRKEKQQNRPSDSLGHKTDAAPGGACGAARAGSDLRRSSRSNSSGRSCCRGHRWKGSTLRRASRNHRLKAREERPTQK